MKLREIIDSKVYMGELKEIHGKPPLIINTINAHSFCMAKEDKEFGQTLAKSNVLLPDGVGITLAARILNGKHVKKIAGWDVHQYLLEKANANNEKVFYLGSTQKTLELISRKISFEFPNITHKHFSPPFKTEFSSRDSSTMISSINEFSPNILFVGMTAPKQEKWVDQFRSEIEADIIVSIGAVFDFYAGTTKRAPNWIINIGMEWFYRLIREPGRMWKRYLINNTKFIYYCFSEMISTNRSLKEV